MTLGVVAHAGVTLACAQDKPRLPAPLAVETTADGRVTRRHYRDFTVGSAEPARALPRPRLGGWLSSPQVLRGGGGGATLPRT